LVDIKGLTSFKSKSISLIILVSLIIWAGIYVKNHIDEFGIISSLSLKYLGILLFLSLLEIFLAGLFTKIIIGSFGITLRSREWFGLSVVTSLGNYLLPFKGGAGLRGIYLKKYHDFPYTYFLTALVATSIIIFFVNSGIGVAGMYLVYAYYKIFNWIIFATLGVFFFLFLAIIIFSPKVPSFRSNFLNKISSAINTWHDIKKGTSVMFKILLIALLHAFFNILIIFFAFRSFSLNISLIQTMIIGSLSILSILIGITPGSLGINEAVIVFSSRLFQITTVVLGFYFGPHFQLYINKQKRTTKRIENLSPSEANTSSR